MNRVCTTKMLPNETAKPNSGPGGCSRVYRATVPAVILVLLGTALSSCKRADSVSANSTTSSANASPKIDACSLLTKEEVGAVQNTTISDTKSSESSDGRHLITQCYYASIAPNLSVSLALTQPSSSGGNASRPRDYWEEVFGRYHNSRTGEDQDKEPNGKGEKSAERRSESEEEKTPPTKIDGVGDEAFWTGSHVGGALYVLRKNYILRISIGGPDTQDARITKSKTLAQKAIERL